MNLIKYFIEIKKNNNDLMFYNILNLIINKSTPLSSIIHLNRVEPISKQKHNHYLEDLITKNIDNYFDFIQYILDSESDFKTAIDIFNFIKINSEFKNSYLFKYGYKIKNNESSQFIGRDEEIKICRILLNRNYKNNLILIGEPGVGKTSIVAEIAEKSEMDIICVEMNAVIAGTKHRGDFEERITQIIEDSIKFEKILFIDEIHVLMNCSNMEGSISATNILKPYLTKNDFRIIGATTTEESFGIMKDKSFERRFNFFKIPEPSSNILVNIIKENFSDIHSNINDEIILKIFEFLNEIKNKFYPDKLIDFLDLWQAYNAHEKKVVDVNKAINFYQICTNIT
ncbi:AAA family ATPase [Fluviispira multicolorata]|uniref:AAA family ATPase n=1 Tax=Fluviispira multicolorata TaxID=2654512 RepID=A0A833JAS8_9BACT|nr:AAA family ATPase [Fluviispira multicolorata]KAB8028483.1 AAA family ATPase [Fluviispira multicolorata]